MRGLFDFLRAKPPRRTPRQETGEAGESAARSQTNPFLGSRNANPSLLTTSPKSPEPSPAATKHLRMRSLGGSTGPTSMPSKSR